MREDLKLLRWLGPTGGGGYRLSLGCSALGPALGQLVGLALECPAASQAIEQAGGRVGEPVQPSGPGTGCAWAGALAGWHGLLVPLQLRSACACNALLLHFYCLRRR